MDNIISYEDSDMPNLPESAIDTSQTTLEYDHSDSFFNIEKNDDEIDISSNNKFSWIEGAKGLDENGTGDVKYDQKFIETGILLDPSSDEVSQTIHQHDEYIEQKHHDNISFSGYSNCCKCSCRGFTGNGVCCDNCGHNFSDHYW